MPARRRAPSLFEVGDGYADEEQTYVYFFRSARPESEGGQVLFAG